MKVIELVTKYSNLKGADSKINLIKKIIKENHLSFATKTSLARGIVTATTKDSDGNFKPDSIKRFFLITYTLLDNYTDLELESGNFSAEYDMLDECGALTAILSEIPEKEKADFSTMVNMAVDDAMLQRDSFRTWIEDMIEKAGALLPMLENALPADERQKIKDMLLENSK